LSFCSDQVFTVRTSAFSRTSVFGFRAFHRVGQLHHIVEIAFRVVAPDLEEVHEAFMAAGDRFILLDPGKLALEGTVVVELGTMNQLDCAVGPQGAARQPYLAVSSGGDGTYQGVLGNQRYARQCRSKSRSIGDHSGGGFLNIKGRMLDCRARLLRSGE